MQAGYEKGMKALTAALAGVDLISGGFGALDSSSVWHLPMVPDRRGDRRLVRRLVGGAEITPETVMLDVIERVGVGGNYLKEKVTRDRVRAGEHFYPVIGSRLPFEQWIAEGRQELDEARAIVEEMLAARAAGGRRLAAQRRPARRPRGGRAAPPLTREGRAAAARPRPALAPARLGARPARPRGRRPAGVRLDLRVDEHGLDPVDAGDGGDVVLDHPAEVLEVAHGDVQQVVEAPGDVVAGADVGQGPDAALEPSMQSVPWRTSSAATKACRPTPRLPGAMMAR